eukprot:TRINITY_DN6647_c0_g1_i3.p1 TRINITY_DN6647_c0_g1~~TRINITY_DN6647_c0_g1_i3.p1  ORF type:complete len:389 (+),score=49.74 TRINITY_DN6647_c0_g1_i3:130-1296(+)
MDFTTNSINIDFADVTEIRTFFNVQHGKELAVVVGPMTDEGLAGIATFPWEATFDKPTFGGFTVGDEFWGDTPLYKLYSSVAGHEAGHCLGLYHVHNGVTEVSGCNDPCFEPQPADGQTGTMLKGDMFSDTRPTPINFYCYDPPRCTSSTSLNCQDCKGNRWVNTPFTNVMSYSDQPAECRVKVFSPQQLGRMRCYYDMYFSDWDNNGEPGVIPLAPSIVRRSNSFALSWEPPINRGTSTPLGYVIERQSSSEVRNFTTNTASFEDFDIRPSTQYTYRVLATNPSGPALFFSAPASAMSPASASPTLEGTQPIPKTVSRSSRKTRSPTYKPFLFGESLSRSKTLHPGNVGADNTARAPIAQESDKAHQIAAAIPLFIILLSTTLFVFV